MPSAPVILGLLSLIFWTLVIVTSLKYAMFAMRIGNRGEGGIMALMSLLVSRRKSRPLVLFAGLFGAALIYGDGAITPAISVLSALEGLNIVLPASQPYILPAAVVILLSLFAIQPLGTARIGRVFGPIMALWFLSIAALGVGHHPASGGAVGAEPAVRHSFPVLERADQLPGAGRRVSVRHRRRSAVRRHGALRQTADLAGPVRHCVSQPVAQLRRPGRADFGRRRRHAEHLLPPVPAGAADPAGDPGYAGDDHRQPRSSAGFSMTRRNPAGVAPRLRVKQTTEESYGQIYIGAINWLLMVVTLFLTVFFKSSDNLAAAYGIAVSLTMIMTTGLLFVAMREVWRWLAASLLVAGCFFVVDLSFLTANLTKVLQGGYIPLLLAAAVIP